MMYAASHIVTSYAPYPAPRGTLILFRLLDDEFFHTLGNDLQTQLEFVPIARAEGAAENESVLKKMRTHHSDQLPRDKAGKLHWLLKDSEHQTMFLVKQKADARGFSEHQVSASVLVGFASSSAILIILALIFSRTVLRRLVEAKATMQSIVATGDYARRLQCDDGDELDTVFMQFNRLLEHIQEQNQDLLKKNQALSELSEKDALTGIANRRLLEAKLQEGWRQCQRAKAPLSVLMIDVDYFKPFNVTYGHQAGDEVLRSLAQAMQQSLFRPNDFLARYGGEEFCVIFPGKDVECSKPYLETVRNDIESYKMQIRDKEHREKTKQKSKQRGRRKKERAGKTVSVTISIGAAEPGEKHVKVDEVLKAADTALYKAKQNGRNCLATN